MYAFCLNVYMYTMYMPNDLKGQKKALDPHNWNFR